MSDETKHFMCEVCGKKLTATAHDAFEMGWDTAPNFKSHTTCETCPLSGTMWYMLMLEQQRREQNR